MPEIFSVLGVEISVLPQNEIMKRVRRFLSSADHHTIFTPNPEMLVAANRDPRFRKILNEGSLNLCDGVGISFVARLKGIKINRYTGVDCMLHMCGIAQEEGRSVYLLGSGDTEVVEKTKLELEKRFSALHIVGIGKGPTIRMINDQLSILNYENENILQDIRSTKPDILFVAFGHKKQEYWIHENLRALPSVKIAMGVGGAFDFVSGKAKRAPSWMRNVGLEWLWRLFLQPWRAVRIWNATVRFLWLCATRR